MTSMLSLDHRNEPAGARNGAPATPVHSSTAKTKAAGAVLTTTARAALAVVAFGSMFLFACSHESEQVKVESVNAPVEVVHAAAVPQLTVVSGTVRSANISPISAKLMGNVTRVLVSEGDLVRAGQPLLEIDARDVRAKADQALAGTAEVEQAIDGADAAVKAAEANAEFANATYKRFAALRERGSVSPQEFEEVAAKRAGADAQLEQARRGREALLARRNQARAAVAEAETFLGYSILRSPVDGIVTARMIDAGAMAAPGMPLLTVEETSHYRVEATLDETLAQSVHQGDAVTLDDGGRHLDARVTNITPSIDPSTRGALVKIALPANSGLRSGTFVKVGFVTGSRNAITLPETAISRRGELTSVYVVDKDGFARMRLVTLGDAQRNGIEILSGLDDGERVVPQVTNELRDGVRIVAVSASEQLHSPASPILSPLRAARGNSLSLLKSRTPQTALGCPSRRVSGKQVAEGRMKGDRS